MTAGEQRRIEKRKAKLLEELTGLGDLVRGSLVETGKKCGRRACPCARGQLHPHRYLSTGTKEGNRIVYVSDRERSAFAEGIRQYERAWELICEISQINIKLIKEAEHA